MRALFLPTTVVACLLLTVPMVSSAQQAAIEAELDGAKALYRDGRLGEAIGALRSVIVKLNELRDVRNRSLQLAEAHFHLGLAFLAMRNDSAALENFRQAAALDPDRILDPEIYSPRVLSVFERARSDVVRRPAAEPRDPPRVESGQPQSGLTALAQPPPGDALLRILPGTKLRVERTGPRSAVEGQLVAVNESVVTIGAENWRVDLPRDTLTRVRVVTGRKNHWIAGMLIGAGLGTLIGALEIPGCGGNDGDCYTRGENMGYGGLGVGLVGGLIGALYKTDVWADVQVDPTSRSAAARPALLLSFAWQF